MRESRTYGSVRAKAEWLSYSTSAGGGNHPSIGDSGAHGFVRLSRGHSLSYPWGLGPRGPDQNSKGCFPLHPLRLRIHGPCSDGFPRRADPKSAQFTGSSRFAS